MGGGNWPRQPLLIAGDACVLTFRATNSAQPTNSPPAAATSDASGGEKRPEGGESGVGGFKAKVTGYSGVVFGIHCAQVLLTHEHTVSVCVCVCVFLCVCVCVYSLLESKCICSYTA